MKSSMMRFLRLASNSLVATLVGAGLLAVSPATAATPPLTKFDCPGGGFYYVDSNGAAFAGGVGSFNDINSTIVLGGECHGTVALDASVTSIETLAFDSAQITSLTLPSSLISIGDGAFGNTPLTQVVIPNSVTTIGRSAFLGAPITSLTLGNSVTSIGSSAFKTASLDVLEIPASVTSIGSSAFQNSPLTSLVIKSTALTVGNHAFTGAKVANLSCFDNLGSAPLTSAQLAAAELPSACVVPVVAPVSDPAPVSQPVSDPAPVSSPPVATPSPTPTPTATPTDSPNPSPSPIVTAPATSKPAAIKTRVVAGFTMGSATMTLTLKREIKKLLALAGAPNSISIAGLTISSKMTAANKRLCEARATAAANYLRQLAKVDLKVKVVGTPPGAKRIRGLQLTFTGSE